MNLAVLYVSVPEAEIMGYKHVVFVDFGKTKKSCCWEIEAMRS